MGLEFREDRLAWFRTWPFGKINEPVLPGRTYTHSPGDGRHTTALVLAVYDAVLEPFPPLYLERSEARVHVLWTWSGERSLQW